MRLFLAFLLSILLGPMAHCAVCPPTGDPGKPGVALGKICSSQTGSCLPGLVCRGTSGCHCELPGSVTTNPNTTTLPTTTSTTSTTVIVTPSPPPPIAAGPCRPNGVDIGTRLKNGQYLQYFPLSGYPHTASQSERDCMEWAAVDRVVELIATVGALAPNATKHAISGLNLVFTRLSVVGQYEGGLQAPGGGVWTLNAFGRHYQVEQDSFETFRAELVAPKVRPLAVVALAGKPDLRNVLDVDPTLTGPAPFVFPPSPPYDATRASLFPVDTRTTLPPCGNGDCALLGAVHAAHMCSTDARCAGVPSTCPSAGLAHIAYELACRGNERCEAFRRVKPFRQVPDSAHWTPAQQCQIARLQDREHMLWADGQLRGDWKAVRKHDTNHAIFHVAMTVGDPRMEYVVMCDVPFQQIGSCFGGHRPMQELLPLLVAAYLPGG